MSDDDPLTADELLELLVLARELIVELEKNRDLLKSQIALLEYDKTMLTIYLKCALGGMIGLTIALLVVLLG